VGHDPTPTYSDAAHRQKAANAVQTAGLEPATAMASTAEATPGPRSVDEAGAILLAGFARFQITCGKGFIYGKRQYNPVMTIAYP